MNTDDFAKRSVRLSAMKALGEWFKSQNINPSQAMVTMASMLGVMLSMSEGEERERGFKRITDLMRAEAEHAARFGESKQ